MEVEVTGCCGVGEIEDLSHCSGPESAMKEFCEIIYEEGTMDDPYGEEGNKRGNIPKNLYTFTGVVKHTDNSSSSRGFTYAPDFKAFILKHKLGTVVESKGRTNIHNHPTHVIKVYVWSVNQRNLKAWHKQH